LGRSMQGMEQVGQKAFFVFGRKLFHPLLYVCQSHRRDSSVPASCRKLSSDQATSYRREREPRKTEVDFSNFGGRPNALSGAPTRRSVQ
jgi:hypothetical protein